MATASPPAISDVNQYARSVVNSASNSIQNAATRVQDEALAEDMVEIHDTGSSSRDHQHPVTQLMNDKHVIKEPTRWGVAEHDVSFSGKGGLMFLLMLFAAMLAIAAFASNGWSVSGVSAPLRKAQARAHYAPSGRNSNVESGTVHLGLWESCVCFSQVPDEPAFHATQAMITISFIFLWIAVIGITLYMCLCLALIKKTYLLIIVIFGSVLSVLFSTIGLIVYASTYKNFKVGAEDIGWSYIVSLFATALTAVTAFVAFVQLRKTVPIC